ncbi:hypothetical protein Bhyg_02314 [Pseudolycoriella hygida]|uniref:Uncharacterized protein n=1 Tax=Pseudolycoriella hygida TaxID=35572 RepID=A0A9Q0S6J2_9DIPT|nr:hypothetical protein Bhyg_02314 [Pseudolycoriella hygida]
MSSRVVNFIINGESFMAVVKSSSQEFTYEDYMDGVPKSCGTNECYYFSNEDGSVISPEVFIPYVNQNFLRQNDKVFVGIINTNDAGVDLADDEILNDLYVIALPSAAQDVESPASYSRNISEQALLNKEIQNGVDDLKRFIINNNGEYLIKKYNENSSLSDPHRKAIVAIIVKKLTTEHTFWPTTEQKIQYAKLAVELLPIYKTTNVNYFELFYDPAKQRGFINSRLKTVQKHIRETTGERKQKLKTGKSSIESSDVNIPQSFSIETLKEQFKDDIEFLSNCPTTETSAILERMKKTFFMRKSI